MDLKKDNGSVLLAKEAQRLLYISHRKPQGEMEPLNSTQELCPSAFYFFHGKRERRLTPEM